MVIAMETVFNQSIWGDEGFSAILSMKSLPDIIKIISHDTSPPLWNIFEHLAFQTFGTSEVVIRSLSFAFFLIAVFFTYKIASLFWSRKTAALAALFTFLNPFFFTYAFEGRMYSIMSAGVAGSMYYFLKSFFGEGGKWTRIGYIFWTLWALYSHHFAIFAIMIQGVWWLYEFAFGRRKTAKRIFKSWLIIGVGYAPWLLPLYNQTKMVGSGFWLGTPNLNDLGKLAIDYLAEGIKDENLKLPMTDIPLYVASFYAVLAALILRKWWRSIKKTIFLLMWFLGPIVLTWLVSQKFQSIFFNRYLLYTIPAAMLLLVSARNKISFLALGVIAALFVAIDYQYYTHPAKLPFRQMAAYVSENRREGDYFINWYSNGTHHIWETKYYGINAPIYVQGKGELPYFVGTALMEKQDVIRQIPEGIERVGVVTSGPVDEVSLPNFQQDGVKEFNGLKFVWYVSSNEE
jgi:uncharacterized membrane protein